MALQGAGSFSRWDMAKKFSSETGTKTPGGCHKNHLLPIIVEDALIFFFKTVSRELGPSFMKYHSA